MKRAIYAAFLALFVLMWVAVAGAAPNDGTATQAIQPQSTVVGEDIISPTSGFSYKEQLMMWREIWDRANARRNALVLEAREREKEKPLRPTVIESPADL